MTHLHFDHTSGMSEFPARPSSSRRDRVDSGDHGRAPVAARLPPAHYDYAFDYRTARATTPTSVELLRDLRPHLRPVRRRQRPARLDARPQRRAPVGDLPARRPRPRDRRRRDLHARPARRRARAAAARSTATTGGARCRSCGSSAATTRRRSILPGHDPEHWETLETSVRSELSRAVEAWAAATRRRRRPAQRLDHAARPCSSSAEYIALTRSKICSRGLELLLAVGSSTRSKRDRLAVLDRDLREARAASSARTLCEPWIATGTTGTPDSSAIRPTPGLRLAELAGARAPALGVDQHAAAASRIEYAVVNASSSWWPRRTGKTPPTRKM